jgi:serine/threonine-protein kinase RsbW
MIVEERRLKIPGVRDRITVACDFVVDAARRAGLDDRAVHHCQLAVDEACTNVIEHGYGLAGEDSPIDITCRIEGDRFVINVLDAGPAFDPLGQADPNPAASLDEREPGGWGIYFIKTVMDEVVYRYEAGHNQLTMVKHVRRLPEAHERPYAARLSVTNPSPAVWVIVPHGRLDAALCSGLTMVVNEQLDAGRRKLIIDMSDVDYVASTGLKTMVSLWQKTRENKGNMVLAAVQPRVYEVLAIIGLDLVFNVFASVREAQANLK